MWRAGDSNGSISGKFKYFWSFNTLLVNCFFSKFMDFFFIPSAWLFSTGRTHSIKLLPALDSFPFLGLTSCQGYNWRVLAEYLAHIKQIFNSPTQSRAGSSGEQQDLMLLVLLCCSRSPQCWTQALEQTMLYSLSWQGFSRCIPQKIWLQSAWKQPFLLPLLSAHWVFYYQLFIFSWGFFGIDSCWGLELSVSEFSWQGNIEHWQPETKAGGWVGWDVGCILQKN